MSSRHNGYVPSALGQAQTVGAVTTTIASIDISTFAGFNADNCSFGVVASILGHSGGGNAAWYEVYGLFKRNSGTLSQVGTTQQTRTLVDTALNATSFVLDSTGTTIRIRAVGVAGSTIDWTGSIELTSSNF